MSAPALSPDGTLVALAGRGGTLVVLEPGGPVRLRYRFPAGAVHTLDWAPDGTHLLLITETSGHERFAPYALRLSDAELLPLAPEGTVQVRGLWTSPEHPRAVVSAVRRRGDRAAHPWYLPLDGAPRQLAHCPDGTRDWAFDPELACRACLVGRPDGTLGLLTTTDGHAWHALAEFPLDDAPDTRLLGVHTRTGEVLLLTAYEARAVRVAAMQPGTGRPRTLLAAPPYDLTTVWQAPDGTPRSALHHAARRHYRSTDPAYRRDLARAALLDAGDLELVGRSGTDDRWLLAFHDPGHRPRHYVYERREGCGIRVRTEAAADGSEEGVAGANTPDADGSRAGAPDIGRSADGPLPGGSGASAVRPAPVARTEDLRLTASDGHPLTAYLTLPVLPAGAPAPPLVLRVHGGPWSRNHWRDDPEAGRLAVLGAAVLKVNYRGSTGYGRDFRDLGDGEWGARMQRDLYDAVDAVAALGAVDPGRVAAYGGSYGGYAALLALTDPRVHCAVAVNPLVDLADSAWADTPYWRRMRALWDKQIGWSRLPRAELRRRSPLHRVTSMHGPALVVRGANDPRIDATGIEAFVRARRAAGGQVDELVLPDDGHAVRSGPGTRAFEAALDAFLARHLDLPAPAPQPPEPSSSTSAARL